MVKFQDLEEQAADEGFGDAQMSDGAMKQYRSDFDCEQRDRLDLSHHAHNYPHHVSLLHCVLTACHHDSFLQR